MVQIYLDAHLAIQNLIFRFAIDWHKLCQDNSIYYLKQFHMYILLMARKLLSPDRWLTGILFLVSPTDNGISAPDVGIMGDVFLCK